jgi:hypothetical protein
MGPPKYVLKGVGLNAAPFPAGALRGAAAAVTITAELEEPVTLVLAAVVSAPAIEQRREHTQKTAKLKNRATIHQG